MPPPPTPDPWYRTGRSGLHVLIATRWYPAFDAPGRGIFVADQAAALAAAGMRVSVAAWEAAVGHGTFARAVGSGAGMRPWLDAIETRATAVPPAAWGAAGVPVARLPAAVAPGALSDPLAAAEQQSEVLLRYGLRLAARQPIDVIHAHTGIPDGIASIALADRLGVPLVVTEHDRSLQTRLKQASMRIAYRRLLQPGRRLVAVSHTLQRQLAEALSVPVEWIEVVPNVVDVETFRAIPVDARDPDELLWVGARKENKGTDVLLAAFRDLHLRAPALRLRMIGRAPSEAEEARLHAFAETLGVADAISWEPDMDRDGVAAAMGRAAVFVHPSPYETFGVVAAEALAAGLPVAATPSGGVPEILGDDGRCGAVATGTDAAALADAVRDVLRRRMTFDAGALRARVVDRYAPASVAQQLMDVYAGVQVVAAPGSPKAPGTPRSAAAPDPAPAVDPLPLIIGLHRASARLRVGALPAGLAAGVLAVTSHDRAQPGSALSSVACWIEIDAEREYRDALARVGGARSPGAGIAPSPASGGARILRAIRNPLRVARRRAITSRRQELTLNAVRPVLREVLAGLASDGRLVEVLPLDLDDAIAIEPLLSDRVQLYPSTIRGLADRWDAAGRPRVAPPPSDVLRAIATDGTDSPLPSATGGAG